MKTSKVIGVALAAIALAVILVAAVMIPSYNTAETTATWSPEQLRAKCLELGFSVVVVEGKTEECASWPAEAVEACKSGKFESYADTTTKRVWECRLAPTFSIALPTAPEAVGVPTPK